MKKTSKFIMLTLCSVFFYLSDLNAQGNRIEPCPSGFCSAGVTFVIDQFNFHKPKTDCKSRFGICIRGHWEANCVPCWSNYRTGLENGKVTGWFIIKENKIELHLPLALGQTIEFINEDMTVFYLDDNMLEILNTDGSVNAKLKGGEYPVTIVDNDYVILIDLF